MSEPRSETVQEPVTVVLADDHPAVLDSVTRTLETEGIRVVATAQDGLAAVAAIELHRPTVAVLDVRLPKLSGIEVARRAVEVTNVCVYTGHRERSLLLDVVALGVRGIVLKEAPLADLTHGIRAAARGRAYYDPMLAGVLMSEEGEHTSAPLTERERSILRFLADGYRNDAIGRSLHIASDTVRAHIRNAMRKLDAATRTQAVATAMRRELID
jgi:two-component system nitrate/nitrite response regulator NarL